MEASKEERKLVGTIRELGEAEEKLAEHESAFMAPRGPVEPATKEDIAAAQKASRRGSPRWKAEQKRHRKEQGVSGRRQEMEYRNYIIYFQRKPGPSFGDWNFHHNDYEESQNSSCSDHRCGYAETPKEARAEIDAQYVDLELDEDGHYTRDGLTLQAGT